MTRPAQTTPATPLIVSNLDHAIRFYTRGLGLALHSRDGDRGAVLVTSDCRQRLELRHQQDTHTRPLRRHAALRLRDRAALAHAVETLWNADIPLKAATDLGASEAILLEDPDGNCLELYRPRPEPDWPRDTAGHPAMISAPLDIASLLGDAA